MYLLVAAWISWIFSTFLWLWMSICSFSVIYLNVSFDCWLTKNEYHIRKSFTLFLLLDSYLPKCTFIYQYIFALIQREPAWSEREERWEDRIKSNRKLLHKRSSMVKHTIAFNTCTRFVLTNHLPKMYNTNKRSCCDVPRKNT